MTGFLRMDMRDLLSHSICCTQKLTELEKKYTLTVEGDCHSDLMRLLRHETAHALDNAYGLRRNRKRQKLFGLSSTPYPKFYSPENRPFEFISNLDDHYGQSHPEEDFAETFAAWLNPEQDWSLLAPPNSIAYKKLLLVDEIMKSLKEKPQAKMKNDTIDEISSLDLTLEQYYLKKRKRLGIVGILDMKKDLNKILSVKEALKSKIKVAKLIDDKQDYLRNTLIQKTYSPSKHHQILKTQKVQSLLKEVQNYCQTENFETDTVKEVL